MADGAGHLSDEAMQGFIRDGYITVQSALPPTYHERMWEALEDLDEGGPRGHNNLLPCVPELSRMLGEPGCAGRWSRSLAPATTCTSTATTISPS